MHSRRTRGPAITAALIATAALVLSGCSGASDPADADSAFDVSPVDFGADVEPTPGNAVLALGEPASIAKDNGTTATVSVLEIIEGDPAIFDEWEDGAEFAGTTPYYVVVQVDHEPGDRTEFAVYPLSDSGETTQYVVNTFGSSKMATGTADCPLELPEFDETTDTQLTCVIGLAEEGETITGALYNGGGYAGFQMYGSDRQYGLTPVTWSADAEEGSVEYAVEAVDLGAPGAATAPGTAVALGSPAWLPLPSDPSKLIGTSVLKIIPGDVSHFDRYPNAADFAAVTPTFIVVQLQYPDDATAEQRSLPSLRPVQADGEYAGWMKSSRPLSGIGNDPGLEECGLVLPLYDPETRTYVGCITATTEGGAAIDHVVYDGETYNAFIANDELGYFSNPVTFR